MLTIERNALHNLNREHILNLIDTEVRIKIWKLEKLNTKCIKLKYGIIFNDSRTHIIYIYINVVIGSRHIVIKIEFNKRSTCWIIINLVEDIILISIFRLYNCNHHQVFNQVKLSAYVLLCM